jgi:hypothetical protein
MFSLLVEESRDERLIRARVYPRVWSSQRVSFVPDRQRTIDRDWADFALRCPQYRERRQPVHVAEPDDTTLSVLAATGPHPGTMNATTNSEEDQNFARLRYLFWRHLDWSQRMRALVHVDVLPNTATNPLPQTIERIALNRARELGKLADLWDIVMNLVPPDRRDSNPFRAS